MNTELNENGTGRARRILVTVGSTVGAAAVLASFASGVAAATPVGLPVTKVPTQALCSTPEPGRLACLSRRQIHPKEPKAFAGGDAVSPNATPSGYGPADLRSAYALTSAGSAAQTVAIVDAQDDPNAESDLAAYRTQYGLPACSTANGCFKKVNENGATSPLPAPDSGWAGEISLDVDMVSAICPNCHILLVEAASATTQDLGNAVNAAVNLGAKFVSNSYGGSETSSDPSTTSEYFNHPGVAITASSGDDGYGVSYPAASTGVTAVGGTSLVRSATPRGWSESVWGSASGGEGAGSGCSSVEPEPAFQNGVIAANCAHRAVADVSAVADPATGVAVYQTYGGSGWNVYGGTSVSSPIVASVYALAGNPGASDQPNTYPYHHRANLNDVTAGTNGSCGGSALCTAAVGWDGPTGLGTPNGTAAFAAGGTTSSPVSATNPGTQTGTIGQPITKITLAASGGTAPYTWTGTGLPAGLSITSTGIFSGVPSVSGSFQVTATAKDSTGATASTTFTVTISAGNCAIGQRFGNAGFESGNTVWTASAGVIGQNGPSEAAHGGTWNAWMDGYGTTHTDTLSQTVTVPAGCTQSSLSFYLHIDTAETTTTTAFDKLTVKINSTVLGTYSNLNHNTGYTLITLPAGSFAGQSATVTFTGTEDSSLQTSFVVDDTALSAS